MPVPTLWKVGQRVTATALNDLAQAVLDLQADVAAALPIITMQTSGTTQAVAANSLTNLSGGGSGWAFVTNAGGVDIRGTAGSSIYPIVIQEAGLYLVNFRVSMTASSTGRGFCDLAVSGGATASLRANAALDDTPSGSFLIPVNTASDAYLTLSEYHLSGANVTTAQITCLKIHD